MKPQQKIKLLDRVRQSTRLKNYSYSTEKSYVYWSKRYILFHDKRHPKTMGGPEIEKFISHLAVERNVSAYAHTVPVSFRENQALCALLFLYQDVLGIKLDSPITSVRAKRPKPLPVVITKTEVQSLLGSMSGKYKLMATLRQRPAPDTCTAQARSASAGVECLRLRVKDIDFNQHQIIVRDGKGPKDRITVSPDAVEQDLPRHLRHIKLLYEDDIANGPSGVSLPYALTVKYPSAQFEWKWQYVFPSIEHHQGSTQR